MPERTSEMPIPWSTVITMSFGRSEPSVRRPESSCSVIERMRVSPRKATRMKSNVEPTRSGWHEELILSSDTPSSPSRERAPEVPTTSSCRLPAGACHVYGSERPGGMVRR